MCGGASSVNRSQPTARHNSCHSSQPSATVERPRAQPLFADDVNECRSHHRNRHHHHRPRAEHKADNGLKKFFDDLIGRLRSSTPAAETPPATTTTPPVSATPPAATTPPAPASEPVATPRNQPPLPAAPPASQFAYPV
jgi:hypothetical protein